MARNVILFSLAAASLSACSAVTDTLRPTPPTAAMASFRQTVQTAAGAGVGITLDHVKQTIGSLFTATGQQEIAKAKQQWITNETTLTGGVAATLGHLSSHAGLLNTGLALALAGLTTDQFYASGRTVATHLNADRMFTCMLQQVGPLSEALRKQALDATQGGAPEAASAIDDVINKVDEALYQYRSAIFTQNPSVASADDFKGFVERYQVAQKNAGDQTKVALDNKSQAIADTKTQTLAVNAAIATADTSRQTTAQTSLDDAKERVAKADANLAGAKFIPLSANLELCIKQFTK